MKTQEQQALDDTTVVAVAYNSADVIETGLGALASARAIVVVDNASTDGSADKIAQRFPNATVIRNSENRGYGRAMNQAMALVETPFALHLNPDAVVTPEALAKLHAAARENGERTAIVAPFLYSPKRGLELSIMGPADRVHGPAAVVPEGRFCTWFVTGAVWLCRMDVWRDVGGFDENIFLYNDDLDYCRSATALGYAIVVEPDARGEHLVSQATRPTVRIRWRKEWNIVWSHLYLDRKYDGPRTARRTAWRLIRKHGPKAVFYGLVIQPKRLLRDLAITHAALSFLMGRSPRPNR